MSWGCNLADKLNVDCFVESTEDGLALYESVGFVVVDHVDLYPVAENPSPSWVRIRDEKFPKTFRVWIMWRPKGGKLADGEIKYPWDE